MNRLAEILEDKGGEVLKVDADASVFSAVERMVANNVGSLTGRPIMSGESSRR